MRPVSVIWCLRKMPSSRAPIRSRALRERWLSTSAVTPPRTHPSVSKAWPSIRYLASVLTGVRCHGRPIHVHPISTLRCAGSHPPTRAPPLTPPAGAPLPRPPPPAPRPPDRHPAVRRLPPAEAHAPDHPPRRGLRGGE